MALKYSNSVTWNLSEPIIFTERILVQISITSITFMPFDVGNKRMFEYKPVWTFPKYEEPETGFWSESWGMNKGSPWGGTLGACLGKSSKMFLPKCNKTIKKKSREFNINLMHLQFIFKRLNKTIFYLSFQFALNCTIFLKKL